MPGVRWLNRTVKSHSQRHGRGGGREDKGAVRNSHNGVQGLIAAYNTRLDLGDSRGIESGSGTSRTSVTPLPLLSSHTPNGNVPQLRVNDEPVDHLLNKGIGSSGVIGTQRRTAAVPAIKERKTTNQHHVKLSAETRTSLSTTDISVVKSPPWRTAIKTSPRAVRSNSDKSLLHVSRVNSPRLGSNRMVVRKAPVLGTASLGLSKNIQDPQMKTGPLKRFTPFGGLQALKDCEVRVFMTINIVVYNDKEPCHL